MKIDDDSNKSPVGWGVARPFVKWVGGKRQLLPEIIRHLPEGIGTKYTKYVEPFVGGGAVLFELLSKYNFEQVIINDMNAGLINTYKTIQNEVDTLIDSLEKLEHDYYALASLEDKQQMFHEARSRFNEFLEGEALQMANKIEFASLFIFLNKTCFNGMYRVNAKGLYNVPFGKHDKPVICDKHNLYAVSKALQKVVILHGSYQQVEHYIDKNTLIYFDPPYRPITDTSSFTAYISGGFGDHEQQELAEFSHSLSQKGAKVVISNSDPKNHKILDCFFDDIYNWAFVRRLHAKRVINSKGTKRGKIREILVTNYRVGEIYAK